MTFDVVCSDGVRRHGGPYPTRREAVHAATWSWCYLGHRIVQNSVPGPEPDHSHDPSGDGIHVSIDLAAMEQGADVPSDASAPVPSLMERLKLAAREATDVGGSPVGPGTRITARPGEALTGDRR